MLEQRAATWPKQWMAEGYEKGHESGLVDGRRLALTDLVEERFGSVSSRYRRLIAEAPETQLGRWQKNVLTAADLEEVFRD